jgi:hypothetical protein
MLIRRLTLVAFALFATAASSLALIGNAAQHARPALADQRDHGHYQQRHDSRRSYGDSRRSSYDGRGNRGNNNSRGRDHGHNN